MLEGIAQGRTRRAVIALLAAALLSLAGCESVSKDVPRQAQEPGYCEPAGEEMSPEQARQIPSAAEPNAAVVVPQSNAIDVTTLRHDATSSSTQLEDQCGAEQESSRSVVASGPNTANRPASNASATRVRVIQPIARSADPVQGRTKTSEDGGTDSSSASAGAAHSQKGGDQTIVSSDKASTDCPPTNCSPPADSAKSLDRQGRRPAVPANADQMVKLDLPPQLDMIQLLDLVGEYLQLDYLYDPEKIKGQIVTLKLHGKLQGQVRVRDLYLLLESVLKFKGFAMTCHEGNLVIIVPATDALKANPDFIDPEGKTLDAGDMVVTDVFDLHHIGVSAASTLLQNMQLSLALTPVEGSQTLIVTCYAHQIERIERLLNIVDRPGVPREFRFRSLQYTLADSLTRKIQVLVSKLGSVSITVGTAPAVPALRPGGPSAAAGKSLPPAGGAGSSDDSVYLDADERTNRILMIGHSDQLAVVEKLVDSLDVAQQDLRILKIYDVQHVEAQEIKKKLQELEIVGEGSRSRTISAGGAGKIATAEIVEGTLAEQPVVVVLEATNSLVINATEEQHARVEAMMAYLDAAARTETIPYEIYSLENQSPENVAQVLEKVIHETVQDKDGKLQKIVRNAEEQIVIVPDKNTFSLIVYASRKNQEWIRKLVETLDRRRPQVLIDVTLAEIRKADEFNYDLNLVTSLPDLVETGGQTSQFYADHDTTVVDKLLQTGRSHFLDFEVDSGTGTGFYADKHINALLRAVQTKNYGRVLAKPKVLVNDNEKGTIKTADTTYVVTKSAIPVTAGTAGPQNTLIETTVKYEAYDAGITLEITPHISEKVLRLEIKLNRSDFTGVTVEKPPDETSSDISTIVTVPDRSTIILGGMLRLNQTKSGSKVPILGDLPLVGGLFRSISNSDIQSKLYIFVRAEVIRPAENGRQGGCDIDAISQKNREAFEKHELEFQNYQDWPGLNPKPVEPKKVLEAR
jgi:general secretion pathway protein D